MAERVTPDMAVALFEEVLRNYKNAREGNSSVFRSYYGWEHIEGLAAVLYLLNETTRLAVISSLWDGLFEIGAIRKLVHLLTRCEERLPTSTVRLVTERALEAWRSENNWERRASCETLELVARLKEVPLDLLPEEVVRTENILEGLAENRHVPAGYIARIIAGLERIPDGVMYCLAGRQDMPAEVLRDIARHALPGSGPPRVSVVTRLADNPATPADVLEKIAGYERTHKNADLRMVLAKNPNTPAKYLSDYAFDDALEVRRRALRNPGLPPEVARKAYKLADRSRYRYEILGALAGNPSCPEDVLMALVFDRHSYVSKAARETLAKRGQQVA